MPCFLCVSREQELNASKITSAFKNLLPAIALCTRDGEESNVPAADLVIGDVVRVRTGTRVPADLRFIHVTDLKVRACRPHARLAVCSVHCCETLRTVAAV
jgi:magnesium-transporting ATPase (P-type)